MEKNRVIATYQQRVRSTFSTSRFFYHKQAKLFTQEVSTLLGGRASYLPFRDEDGMKVLEVVSAKTAKSVKFYVVSTDRDTDGDRGDIAGWNLEPTPESQRLVPECRGVRMLVIND